MVEGGNDESLIRYQAGGNNAGADCPVHPHSFFRLAFKLIDTLRRVDDLLADTKRMTTIAAARTEQVDEQIDRAIEMFTNVGDKINENRSIIKTAGNVGTAAGALRSFRKKSKKRANRYETSGMDYERPNRIRRRRFR